MSEEQILTTIQMHDTENRVMLTYVITPTDLKRAPITVICSMDVVSAREFISQIERVILDIGKRQFEKAKVPEKQFIVKDSRSHA